MFTVASGFWFDTIAADANTSYMDSTVMLPFTIGGIIFIIGCYLGFFEVINSDPGHAEEMRKTVFYMSYSDLKKTYRCGGMEISDGDLFYSWSGSFAYFIGALIYMVGCLSGVSYFLNLCTSMGVGLSLFDAVGAGANVLGGALFWYGGMCEFIINECHCFRPKDSEWWVAILNAVGGFLFFGSGVGESA